MEDSLRDVKRASGGRKLCRELFAERHEDNLINHTRLLSQNAIRTFMVLNPELKMIQEKKHKIEMRQLLEKKQKNIYSNKEYMARAGI